MALTGARVVTTASHWNYSTESIMSFGSATQHGATFWSAGQPTRLTIPAGISKLKFYWGGEEVYDKGTSSYWSRLVKNGVTHFQSPVDLINRRGYCCHGRVTGLVDVTPGDYIEVWNRAYSSGFNWIAGASISAFTPDSVIGHVLAHIAADVTTTAAHTEFTWAAPDYDNLGTHNGTTGFVVPPGASYAAVTVSGRTTSDGGPQVIYRAHLDGTRVAKGDGEHSERGAGFTFPVFPVTPGEVLTLDHWNESTRTLDADFTFVSIEWFGETA